MSRTFQDVRSLQQHLKSNIITSIEGRISEICIETVKGYLKKNVYDAYIPKADSYDRTMELMNSVTVGNINVGTKYITFDIFMDTNKINPYIRTNVHRYGGWNAHADVYDLDMSDYIPLWVEEGTEGSLWDREPAHYMYDSWVDLSGGDLAEALESALQSEGWKIVKVS